MFSNEILNMEFPFQKASEPHKHLDILEILCFHLELENIKI